MPVITIPRSDGTSSRWPENYLDHPVDINSNPNYHEQVDFNHPKSKLFRDRIAIHLATEAGFPDPLKYTLSDLPAGYSLFLHHKQQKDMSDRTDVYMFGSKHVLKFRSPNEFFGHASWLMNPDSDLENHKQCTCKYSQNPAPAFENPSKRKAEKAEKATQSKMTPQEKAHKKLKVDASHEEGYATSMSWDDLMGKRKSYREGELVWCKLPVSIANPTPSTGCPPVIDRWPGIIVRDEVQIRKAQPVVDNAPSGSEQMTKMQADGGVVVQTTQYVVKYLGRIKHRKLGSPDPEDAFVRLEESEVLPWAAVHEEFKALHHHVKNIVEAYIKQHATSTEDLARAKTNWRKELMKQSSEPIESFAKEGRWDLLCLHYAYALKVAMNIAHTWTQTNGYKVETVSGAGSTEIKKTYFQGLWYGAERLWQHELIRLNKTRGSLPDGSLLAPTPDSSNRGVFLRMALICMEEVKSDGESIFNCLIHGDLFDVVDQKWMVGKAQDGEPPGVEALDRPPMPAAPKGCVFRQINPPDSEVTCDITDLGGRLYMNLAVSPWLKAMGTTSTPEVKRLMALVEGAVGPQSIEWKESRRRIVTDNHNAADDWIEQLLSASKITPPAAAELEVSKSLEADIGNSQNNQPTAVVADPPNGLAHDGDVVMATS